MTRRAIAGLFIVWLVVVAAGLAALWRYAQTPGPAAHAPGSWPAASRVARDTGRPTLVMFAHPKCACSRATIGELAVLMAHVQHKVAAHVLFYRPSGADSSWDRTDLWESAAAIPGVTVSSDENGAEAALFGSEASGQALLYDASGRLVFSGGITSARGHAGDNAGRSALMALLTNNLTARVESTPVFGCTLRELSTP
jgi:hypothetical protein